MTEVLRSYSQVRKKVHRPWKRRRHGLEKRRHDIWSDCDTQPLALPPVEWSESTGPADLAIENAAVPGRAGCWTILVRAGVIDWVGPAEEAGDRIDGVSRRIDASGKWVTAGWTDNHLHLAMGAERLTGCDLEPVTDADAMVKRLTEYAKSHADVPVIFGFGLHYFDPPLIPADRARQVLDQMIDDRPVFICAHDLHTGWANTLALKECDLFHAMPPYPRTLEHLNLTENMVLDDAGYPSGELREPNAYFLVEAALRAKYPLSTDQKLDALEAACLELAREGITCVQNMGLDLPEEDIETLMLLFELERQGRLPIRVCTSMSIVPDEHMMDDIHTAASLRDLVRDARAGAIDAEALHKSLDTTAHRVLAERHSRTPEHVEAHHDARHHASAHLRDLISRIHVKPHAESLADRLSAGREHWFDSRCKVYFHTVKLFMDGVVEKDTAWRSSQAAGAGVPGFPVPALRHAVAAADRLGLQVAAHCIGDRSVQMFLDAVGEARAANRSVDDARDEQVRHRAEHIELCQIADIPKFDAYGVIASMQPFHARAPKTLWHEKVPVCQWPTAFAWRSFLDAGARLIFGSDWPIVSCDCLAAMRHAVSRKPWTDQVAGQGIKPAEAMAGFGDQAAYGCYHENQRGLIEPGFLADLVLVEGPQPDQAQADGVQQVVMTICDGQICYQRAALSD